MRFRLAPNLSTLDDLERPKHTFDWHQIEIGKSCSAHQKNLNEDRHKLPVPKCRSMILLSKSKKYMRRFVWTHRAVLFAIAHLSCFMMS